MQTSAWARVVPSILLALGCPAASSTTAGDTDETSTAQPDATDTTTQTDPASSDPSGETTSSTTAPGDDSTSEPTTSSPTTSEPTTSTDDTSPTTDTGAPIDDIPPIDAATLLPWLQRGEYLAWTAESGVHASAGPHGGGVRTFVNSALFDSLTAGSAEHPVDAAAVKELYEGDGVVGWAVIVKVAPGVGGDAWYWYERIGATVYADAIGEALCFECHAIGVDQVRTPFPLQ